MTEGCAIVTGGGCGIGAATALAMAARGVEVPAVSRNPDGLQEHPARIRLRQSASPPIRQSQCSECSWARRHRLLRGLMETAESGPAAFRLDRFTSSPEVRPARTVGTAVAALLIEPPADLNGRILRYRPDGWESTNG